MRKSKKSLMLGLGLCAAACGGSGADGQPDESAAQPAMETVLASVQLTDTRRVNFTEMGGEAVTIDDSFPMDIAENAIDIPMFDSAKWTLVGYYQELCERSRLHVSPSADDVARLAKADAKVAQGTPATPAAPAALGSDVGTVRSAVVNNNWGDYNASAQYSGDYAWFSQNWCLHTNAPTDYCQVGLLNQWVTTSTQRTVIFTMFNESFTDDNAQMYVQRDTCSSGTSLCGPPPVVYHHVLPHRTVTWTAALQYNSSHTWVVKGSAEHWGRAIIFDN
jgi:hypothetical protein